MLLIVVNDLSCYYETNHTSLALHFVLKVYWEVSESFIKLWDYIYSMFNTYIKILWANGYCYKNIVSVSKQ